MLLLRNLHLTGYALIVLQSLIDICIENAGELLRSNFGREVLYEVVNCFTADMYLIAIFS